MPTIIQILSCFHRTCLATPHVKMIVPYFPQDHSQGSWNYRAKGRATSKGRKDSFRTCKGPSIQTLNRYMSCFPWKLRKWYTVILILDICLLHDWHLNITFEQPSLIKTYWVILLLVYNKCYNLLIQLYIVLRSFPSWWVEAFWYCK